MTESKMKDIETIAYLLLLIEEIKENNRAIESYLRGYRDGILALKSNT